MRATVAVIALLLSGAKPARADGFDPRDYDKIAHMTTSYGITLTVAVVARHYEMTRWKAALLGAGTALLLGTAKELLHDETFDWGDELGNTIGATTAVGVVFAFKL